MIMPDPDSGAAGAEESVVETAAGCFKESFAELLQSWQAAVERSEEDPEHVHRLRVVTRRISAVLWLFEEWFPAGKTRKILRHLRMVRKSAGPARNCDVFAARWTRNGTDRKSPARGGPNSELRVEAPRQLVESLRQQRVAAQNTLVAGYDKYVRRDKLDRVATSLLGGLRRRGTPARRESTPFRTWAPGRLRRAARDFFAEANVNTERSKRLHQFRIRAKQFRYCLEWLRPAFANPRFLKASSEVRKLCQRLGTINDYVTSVRMLSRWLDAEVDAESIRVLRRWRRAEKRSLRRAVSKFGNWWSARRRRRLRRLFSEVVKSPRVANLPR